MNKSILTITGLMMLAITVPVMAGEHGHHMNKDQHQTSMQNDVNKVFLIKKEIDDFMVSFHVMQAPPKMQQNGTHHLMIKIEQRGKALTDLMVNSKVIHPNGKAESKGLMKMGEWYMAAYNLAHEGNHQLMVLFKTADGVKHFGGVYFPDQTSAQHKDQQQNDHHDGGKSHDQHH